MPPDEGGSCGDGDEGLGERGDLVVVAHEAAAFHDPGEGARDAPAAGQDDEAGRNSASEGARRTTLPPPSFTTARDVTHPRPRSGGSRGPISAHSSSETLILGGNRDFLLAARRG